uniref:ATP synthase subunit s-like protein n=1 Tax=Amblyomma triste TaxID=251400 RepID=A0A023GB18_AMBTT
MLRRLPKVLGLTAKAKNNNPLLRSTRYVSSDWERKKQKARRVVNNSDDYVAIDSRPNLLEKAGSMFKGLGVDFVSGMQKIPTYFTKGAAFERKLYREKMSRLVSQKFIPERHGILGPDLAAASFLVFRGALVKFHGNDKWFKRTKDGDTGLPGKRQPGWVLEAIDASDTEIYYEGLDNLTCLEGLKSLKLAGNPNIDDWFLDRLSQFRETLEHLDLSGCPQITEHGLAALYRLRKLKTITLAHLSHIQHIKLVALMLEEAIPGCRVLGVNYYETDAPSEQTEEPSSREPEQQESGDWRTKQFARTDKMEDDSELGKRRANL